MASESFDASVPSYELDLMRPEHAVDFVRRGLRAGRSMLRDWRQAVSMNLGFYAGQHHIVWEPDQDVVSPDPRVSQDVDYRNPFTKINMHRLMATARLVRIWQGNVTFKAKPMFADTPVGEQIETISSHLGWWWHRLKIEQGQRLWKALVHFVNAGRIYGSVTWNENARNAVHFKKEELYRRLNEFAQQVAERLAPAEMPRDAEELLTLYCIEELRTHPLNLQFDEERDEFYVDGAEARAELIDGFRVVEDMSTDEWDDKWWVIVEYRLPVLTIRERYGPAANHVRGEHGAIDSFADDVGVHTEPIPAIEGGSMESSRVYVLWHRATGPRGQYPKGVRVDVCEDRVVQGPHENTYRRLPVFPIVCDPDPWGNAPDGSDPRESCVMSDVRTLNHTLNVQAEQIARHTAHAIEPDMLVPKGSIDPDFMTTHPGPQFWDPGVSQGAKPEPLQLPPLPAAAPQMMFGTIGMIERLASTNAPSQGVPSSQAKSGIAIQSLQAADSLMQEIPVDGWRSGLATMGVRIVETIARFSPEGQVLRGLRDGEPIILNAFDNRLFVGRPNGELDPMFDLEVTIGQRHTEQSIAERAMMMQKAGWLDPMAHRGLIFKALRTGDATVLDPTRRDRKRIAREHDVVATLSDLMNEGRMTRESVIELFGVHVRVRLGDNPTVHVDEHLDFIASQEPRLHPLLVDLLIAHVERHGRIAMAGMGVNQAQGTGNRPPVSPQLPRPGPPQIAAAPQRTSGTASRPVPNAA